MWKISTWTHNECSTPLNYGRLAECGYRLRTFSQSSAQNYSGQGTSKVGMAKKRKITIGEGGPGATDGRTDGRTRHFLVALRHYEALFFFAEREECVVFGVGARRSGPDRFSETETAEVKVGQNQSRK